MPAPEGASPRLGLEGFHCPNCGVLAKQEWFGVFGHGTNRYPQIDSWNASQCEHCRAFALWQGERLKFPDAPARARPNADMAEEIQRTFEEAASISSASPRGAAALLRLCVQLLCRQLGEPGENINADIMSLVKKGLPAEIQQALDVVRVIGNNAVHPGEINLEDQPDTVDALFVLVNAIADRLITQPKKIAALYGNLPPSIQGAIAKRDGRQPG